jgi:hypothetical protein
MHKKAARVSGAAGVGRRPSSHHTLGRIMMMVLKPILVATNLSVQLVNQFIDRGVQIGMRTFREQVIALHMNVAFGPLPSFLFLLLLNSQQYLDVHNLVKVASNSIELGRDVIAQGGCNFKVMTADRQVHK